MSNLQFVLDSNVFIESKKRHYAFDLAPGFWKSLIKFSKEGTIISIDRVKKELERGKDDLSEWIKREFTHAFNSTDKEDVISSYSDIMNYIGSNNQYKDTAISSFAGGADPWLIAYSLHTNNILVTEEVLNLKSKKRVPIPNVCREFGVEYINTFEMLRRLGVKFRCD